MTNSKPAVATASACLGSIGTTVMVAGQVGTELAAGSIGTTVMVAGAVGAEVGL